MFESHLAQALSALDPARVTWLEAESSKIGERLVPPQIWAAMQASPRLRLTAPLAARARFLTRSYSDLTSDAAKLRDQIDQLRPYHAADLVARWHAQAQTGAWVDLAASLIAAHYDPRYAKSTGRSDAEVTAVDLPDLQEATLAATAQRLINETPAS